MPEDIDDAAHWRALAADAFRLAATFNDPSAKQTMLSIALGYEHIAQRAERRADLKRAGRRRPDDGVNLLTALLPILAFLN